MDFLHTVDDEYANNVEPAAVTKSDAPDGLLSDIVRFGVAGVCGATSAILNECSGGASNVRGGVAGAANERGEPDILKQPKYKRQLGCPGPDASVKRPKSEKAGTAKRSKEA